MESKILSDEAQEFLRALHRTFNARRLALLAEREHRQKRIDQGENPQFLPESAALRDDPQWSVMSPPPDLTTRTVEITGPVERKMMINALNSGADLFMADFEDALSPTWNHVLDGQQNLMDAVRRTISLTTPEGKSYTLNPTIATLCVRPRGWHLPEKHYLVDGEPMSGSLFDFGLYLFHNAKELLARGSGPYFYLPKLENHFEAALWADVFRFSEEYLQLPPRSIKVTVLIETILAAFEMEEILYALKDYIVGLNAGRWDYIFSIIKKFAARKELNLPDRGSITMAVPFMQAYAELLVKTCLKRGAQPIGGMSAFVPSRKDEELNAKAFAKVREDKQREASQGFIGTWVAHPDLVKVARESMLSGAAKKPRSQGITEEQLLNFQVQGGKVTDEGVRQNVEVAIDYIDAWLQGLGAVALHNLMEDAATAEISRAQLWQWVHHGAVPQEKVLKLIDESSKQQSKRLLNHLVASKPFIDFFTLEAYKEL